MTNICDYFKCSNLIREEDTTFTSPTKRYCKEHGKEIDSIIDEDDAGKLLGWWVKSMGGAKIAAEKFYNG